MNCCPPGGEQADQFGAAAADAEGERTSASNAAGVSEPARPHAHVLPYRPNRRLSAPTGGTGEAEEIQNKNMLRKPPEVPT